MLLCRAATLLLLLYIAAEGQAAGDSQELHQLKSTVHRLKDNVFDLTADVTAQLSGMTAQVLDLTTQVLDLTTQNTNLTTQVSDLMAQVSDLSAQNTNMTAHNTNLTAQVAWLNEQPDFKQWVENKAFNDDQSKIILSEITENLQSQDTRIQELKREVTGRLHSITSVLESRVPDDTGLRSLDSRVMGIEEQLHCSASEQLRVCERRPEWVTVVVGGSVGNATDAVQVLGGDPAITLPNYPHSIYHNRMTTIGSKVYSCGGYVNGNASEECFMIDMKDNDKKWQKSHPLPHASNNHHISGANGDIMAIYEDGSISVNNATIYEVFNNGSINWVSCLASNSTHSFFVQGGIVFMNANASDPANWKNIAAIDISGSGVACLLLDAVLYITRWEKLFMINTDTFIVLSGASPNTPKIWHGMGVINGRVAVVGGWDYSKRSDVIETYDLQTDMWQTHHWKLLRPTSAIGIVSLQL